MKIRQQQLSQKKVVKVINLIKYNITSINKVLATIPFFYVKN